MQIGTTIALVTGLVWQVRLMKEDADRNDYCACNWSCLAGSVDEADEGGCRSEQAAGPEAQQGGGPAQEGAAEEGGPHPHPGEQAPPAGHGAQTQTGRGEYTGIPALLAQLLQAQFEQLLNSSVVYDCSRPQ